MKNALFAAALCVAGIPAVAADSDDTKKAVTPGDVQTVKSLTDEACASGQKVVKTVKKTVMRNFSGRMVPQSVKVQKTVCN